MVIVGAGIGGPALGIALKRAGIESIVYEASDEPRDDAGAFLNLAPNGLAVLQALGLGAAPRRTRLSERPSRLSQRDRPHAGGGASRRRDSDARRGESSVTRAAAEEAGVRFEFGKTLSSVTEHDGNVTARFADGTTVDGSSLVGADGIHSRTRYSYFTDAPKPTYTGIINLGGVVQTDLQPTGRAMHMIFGRSGFFGTRFARVVRRTGSATSHRKKEPSRGALMNATSDSYRQQLLEVHESDPPEVTRILQALSGPIGAWPVYDILSLPAWHRGAVCLMGDAAHAVGPHVGQGASLALEDAFVLAKCLRDIPEASSAFSAFERLRRSRVEPILKQSRRTGQQKAPTGWLGRRIRDLILPIFLKSGARAANELYGYALDWEKRVA